MVVAEAEEDQVDLEDEIEEEDLVEEVAMEEEMTNLDHLVVKESHFLMTNQSLSVAIDHNQIQDM